MEQECPRGLVAKELLVTEQKNARKIRDHDSPRLTKRNQTYSGLVMIETIYYKLAITCLDLNHIY